MDINERLKKEAEAREFERQKTLKAMDLLKDDKDKFRVLSEEEARKKLPPGAYKDGILYQENLTTGEITTKTIGPKEVIKEQTDEYVKKGSQASKLKLTIKKVQDAETAFLNANKFTQIIRHIT